jgi:hypothetical protein
VVGLSVTPVSDISAHQLHALAMLELARGTIALQPAVTDVLDGAPPRHVASSAASRRRRAPACGASIAIAAATPRSSRRWSARSIASRSSKSSASSRPACSKPVCVARPRSRWMLPPGEQPRPWPDGAGLVLGIEHGRTASAWVADVPAL